MLQARGMREQVQSMGAKVAALQAHCDTLQGESKHWKTMWRQTCAANSELSQRVASAGLSQQVGILPCVGSHTTSLKSIRFSSTAMRAGPHQDPCV